MKKRVAIGFVVLLLTFLCLGFLATTAWAHGMGGVGATHGGFHGGAGGFHGHFGGFHGGFSHPGVQGFSHFDHFQHEQFFGPHHHFGPFVPPGHEQHVEHELFLGPHHHFGGFHNGFFFRDRGSFVGRPFFPVSPGALVISAPFFCVPDRLEFSDQALFFDHLHQVHGIPLERAFSSCHFLSGGQLGFFGF